MKKIKIEVLCSICNLGYYETKKGYVLSDGRIKFENNSYSTIDEAIQFLENSNINLYAYDKKIKKLRDKFLRKYEKIKNELKVKNESK